MRRNFIFSSPSIPICYHAVNVPCNTTITTLILPSTNCLRPQQTSPAGSVGSNHRPPYGQHPHHFPHHGQQPHPQHLQPQQQYNQNPQHQQPQINRPPLPTTSSTDQNLNPQQSAHLHAQHVANSRASSSSGGNASTTVQSTGGGSISGTTGPSPSGVKQEQRLTHEQVWLVDCFRVGIPVTLFCSQFRAALQMVVSAGDPRENLENFMKIGEGSTGTVCIATDRSTGNETLKEFHLEKL